MKTRCVLLLLLLTACGKQPGPSFQVISAPPACPSQVVRDAWLDGCLTFATKSDEREECFEAYLAAQRDAGDEPLVPNTPAPLPSVSPETPKHGGGK